VTIPLSQQLDCAREVLAKMRANKSRWCEAQEAIVATLERQEMLRQVSNEICGRKTETVEVAR
jgi:hypothetical protein